MDDSTFQPGTDSADARTPGRRNPLIDQMRGLLMILVVLGHSIEFSLYKGTDAFWSDPLMRLIYMFHMPMFMALSGDVSFRSAAAKDTAEVQKSRTLQLLPPILVWSLLQGLVLVVTSWIQQKTVGFGYFFDSSIRSSLSMFWFLTALLFATYAVLAAKILRRDTPIGLLVLSLAVAVTPIDNMLFCEIRYVFPFFCLGWTISAHPGVLHFAVRHARILLPAVLAAALFCYPHWTRDTYIYVSGMRFDDIASAENVLFRYLAGLVGGAAFTGLAWWACRGKTLSWLALIGRASLSIYLMQTLLMPLLADFDIRLGLPLAVAYAAHALLAVSICCALAWIAVALGGRLPAWTSILLGMPPLARTERTAPVHHIAGAAPG